MSDALRISEHDPLILTHAAIGEEVVFRIAPHMLGLSTFTRLLISGPIYGLMHCIPLLKTRECISERFLQAFHATIFGMVLIYLELYAGEEPPVWYIETIVGHVLVNIPIWSYQIHVGTMYS